MSGDTGAGPSACVGGATPGTGPAWGAAWGAADRLLLEVLRGEGVHQHEATIPEQHVATSEPRAALVHVHASARRHGDRQERPTASYKAARVQGLPELRRFTSRALLQRDEADDGEKRPGKEIGLDGGGLANGGEEHVQTQGQAGGRGVRGGGTGGRRLGNTATATPQVQGQRRVLAAHAGPA